MIRVINTGLRPIAWFLSIAVMFQCCMVYDKKPVTIEEAINKNHKKAKSIKIEFTNGDKLVLDSVYYKDNELYGLAKIVIEAADSEKDEMKFENLPYSYTHNDITRFKYEVKIDENKIYIIKIQNKTKSITANVFIFLSPFLVAALVITIVCAIDSGCLY